MKAITNRNKNFLITLISLEDTSIGILMIYRALDITVLTTRRQMPRKVERQHIAEITTVL